MASYQKLRADIERKPLIGDDTEPGLQLSEAEGGFEFKNVSFKYPSRPEVTVLNHLDLSIPAKKHTAIVGLSGSGKSTIAGLVARLYDPTEGFITFDHHDLREIDPCSLRSYLSIVQQEASLFDRSFLENIAYGLINSNRPEHAQLKPLLIGPELAELAEEIRMGGDMITAAEKRGRDIVEIVKLVRHAATLADADAFISATQHGYGTIVGSGGRLVSGGQKQRVALARAVVKNPAVLILEDRKSTRLNSSHSGESRMPSSA